MFNQVRSVDCKKLNINYLRFFEFKQNTVKIIKNQIKKKTWHVPQLKNNLKIF